MGGGEWVHRGLRVQAIMCLLEAFDNENNWSAFRYDPEPNTGEDVDGLEQVDIYWEYGEENSSDFRTKVVQVKSSINPVNRAKAEGWCKQLSTSLADGKELRLVCPAIEDKLPEQHFNVSIPKPFIINLRIFDDAVSQRIRNYFEREFLVHLSSTETLLVQESLETKLFKSVSERKKYSRQELKNLLGAAAGISENQQVSLMQKEITEIDYFRKLFSYDESRSLRPAVLNFYFWTSGRFKANDIKLASRFYKLRDNALAIKLKRGDKFELFFLTLTSTITIAFLILFLLLILDVNPGKYGVLKILGVATILFSYGLIVKKQFLPFFEAWRIRKELNKPNSSYT